ncbi:putative high affinity copper protein [Biscogniauxia marginata]|nr:putative high affinity copper protein [Biscogniauxia marginata]
MDEISTTISPATGMTNPSSTGHSTFDFTPAGSDPTPTPSTAGMGDMDGMGAMDAIEGDCRISMLWNWDTVGACFLSKSWQIKSEGGFAALCIGVILLVLLLELLRRTAKTYDRHLIRQHQKSANLAADKAHPRGETANGSPLIAKSHHALVPPVPFRPNIRQQAIRALLHTLQFALAYWIMLLAMYYNGYIIISIIIGAFIGSFIFQWERIGHRSDDEIGAGAAQESTGCCG